MTHGDSVHCTNSIPVEHQMLTQQTNRDTMNVRLAPGTRKEKQLGSQNNKSATMLVPTDSKKQFQRFWIIAQDSLQVLLISRYKLK